MSARSFRCLTSLRRSIISIAIVLHTMASAEVLAQEGRILLQVGLGSTEADGFLSIPFVAENGVITSGRGGADNTELSASISIGYRVVGGLYLEAGFANLGEFDSDREVSDLRPAARIREWSLATRYHHPLTDRMSAMWRVGVTRANIDTDRLTIVRNRPPGFVGFPRTFSTEPIPDESGWTWGTGLQWRINEKIEAGFAYHSHDLDRTDLATLTFLVNLYLRN